MSDPASPRPRRFDREVDGILLLDKPSGMSSNSALQQARRAYRALKAGHAGSLDPLASGLLPVCFGLATKVCGQLLESGKAYRVAARLGTKTDTADAEGTVVEEQPVPPLSEARVLGVLGQFIGEQSQIPPMYSALKHEGRRLYEIARKGGTVERAARMIRIDSIDLKGLSPGSLDLDVACSKGTYIRTLVEDIASALGTVGHVSSLRRLRVDPFGDHPMVSLADVEALAGQGNAPALGRLLLPLDSVFLTLPEASVDAAGEIHLIHGRRAWPADPVVATGRALQAPTITRVYGPERRFIGLARREEDGALQPARLFVKAAGIRA